MNNNTIGRSYALALLDIGKEKSIDIKPQLDSFWELVRTSSDLEALLFMDVFTVDERKEVLESVFEKLKLDDLIKNFLMFLVEAKRISLFPSIYTSVTMEKDLADIIGSLKK